MKKGKGKNGILPSSLRIISSCLKNVSSNAGSVASTVRSAGASVAASVAVPAVERDEVLWAGFDKIELSPSSFRHVLLLGYSNGFQVLDVEDASNVCELVSKRESPITYLQMQPTPANTSESNGGFQSLHPLLIVVAGDETNGSGMVQGGRLSALIRENGNSENHDNSTTTSTVVRFYSLKSHSYVHVLRFRSTVYLVRCSPRVVAVALAAQIYCFDAVSLENKFSVLTYPLQAPVGSHNIGYGPMAVGPRWLAYASNSPLLSNTGRLSPQNLSPSPGVSPSTSPGNGSLVARYAVESSKQLAAGLLNLGDMGYKTLSKYCQERSPDGSTSTSPLSSNSSRRFGRVPSFGHPSEADNAGMVVIKDFISKEVISQFKAHSSPISALCFDPSGTLLVTASITGYNINVFRIMPTCLHNTRSSTRYDYNSSHVHLYKLYRGMTTAVIQDIGFSHFSQWVAIVSQKGTCHIYVLSPFGGDSNLQPQNGHSDGPSLVPNITLPWWSTSSCSTDQQLPIPPPPVMLSVVSRIKNSNSGWLNTVSNVAATATGKVTVPSGAVAVTFHDLVCTKVNSLEHILVYSPSGHLIQYELLPSLSCSELSDCSSGNNSGQLLQDDELRVNAEPVQWWDVCRRSNWPEREETIYKNLSDVHSCAETKMDTSNCEDVESLSRSANKIQDRPHLYLSNAEVQVNSGRLPIWQKSKICFYVMVPLGNTDCTTGEAEIENFPLHEIEVKRKDLLPVFEQFHRSQPLWGDRGYMNGPLSHGTEKDFKGFSSTTTIPKSSPHQTQSDDVKLQFMESSTPQLPAESCSTVVHSELEGIKYSAKDCSLINGPVANSTKSSGCSMSSEISDPCLPNAVEKEQSVNPNSCNSVEFAQYFHEGYCKAREVGDDTGYLNETVTDAESSSSHQGREKQEDGDNNDMLEGVFAFFEEDVTEAG